MKLYAKISSERASKGQGGNKYLIIDILGEKLDGIPTRTNLYRLSVVNDSGKLYAEIMDYSNHDTIVLTKGKKEKGKCGKCHDTQFYLAENGEMKLCENH